MSVKNFVVICSLFLGILSIGVYGATPGEIPALPQSPPPKVKYIEQLSATDGDMSINRGAGRQIVTFSVEQVESVWGLDRMLYRLEGDNYVLIDPIKSPQSSEPGVAYRTYFDKPETVCCRHKSLPYHSLNLPGGYQDGALRICFDGRASNAVSLVAEEQAVEEISKTNNVGKKERQGQPSELDDFIGANIAQADANFAASMPLQKLVDDPVHFDNIDFAKIQEQQEQISQSIKNLEATTTENGRLLINRELEANRRIGEARVRSIVPEDRHNLLDYALGPKGSPGNLTLSGVVTDSNSRPLDHAKVKLSNGRVTYTDKLGRFSIENLSAGRGSITISKPGYKSGSGKVDLTKGQNEKIRVSLSPESKGHKNYDKNAAQKGNFYVKAYPLKVGPKERRIYVSKIEVWEDGNYSHRWEKTWWEDYDDDYYELRCDEAEIGKIYNITITWKSHKPGDSGRSDKWTKRFNSRDEVFSFDHP